MAQQRQLCYEGRMNTFTATEKFRGQVPLNSDLDRVVRQPTEDIPLHILSNAGTHIMLTGTYLIFPASGAAFPGLFEFRDPRSGKSLCIDTRFCQGERRIALVLEGDSFDFRWDGNRMMFLPRTQPLILKAFPQHNYWYKCEATTMITVEDNPSNGQALVPVKLFLERNIDPWFGQIGRSLNAGNSEEQYLYAFGSPAVERVVFIWKPLQPSIECREPRRKRRIVQVPASAPISKEPPKAQQPPIAYQDFVREWNNQRLLHSLDRSYSDPGPVPDQKAFETLLREGKIRIEK